MNSRRSCLLSWCESNGVDLDGRLDISDEKILSNDFILKDSVGWLLYHSYYSI